LSALLLLFFLAATIVAIIIGVHLCRYYTLAACFFALRVIYPRTPKSVFSFLRQLTTWHCPHMLLRAVLRRRCC